MNTKIISLPLYAKKYLLDHDDSNLSGIDKLVINYWIESTNPVILSCDDIPYYSYKPAFGLECTVIDCVILHN